MAAQLAERVRKEARLLPFPTCAQPLVPRWSFPIKGDQGDLPAMDVCMCID